MKTLLKWLFRAFLFVLTITAIICLTGQKAESVSWSEIALIAVSLSIILGLFMFLIESYVVPWFLMRTAKKIKTLFHCTRLEPNLFRSELVGFDLFITFGYELSLSFHSTDLVSFYSPIDQLEGTPVHVKYKKHIETVNGTECYRLWQTNSMGLKIAKKKLVKIFKSAMS